MSSLPLKCITYVWFLYIFIFLLKYEGGNHGIIGGNHILVEKKGDNQWGKIQLRENQRTPGHITAGGFVGRGKLVKVLYCKLPLIGN